MEVKVNRNVIRNVIRNDTQMLRLVVPAFVLTVTKVGSQIQVQANVSDLFLPRFTNASVNKCDVSTSASVNKCE